MDIRPRQQGLRSRDELAHVATGQFRRVKYCTALPVEHRAAVDDFSDSILYVPLMTYSLRAVHGRFASPA